MLKRKPVASPLETDSMNSCQFADTHGRDIRLQPHIPVNVRRQCLRGPARRVQLMAMMFFHDVRRIAPVLRQQLGNQVHCRRKDIDSDGEVRTPDERRIAFFEIVENLAADVVPSCSTHDRSCKILSNELIIGTEGFRSGKVNADAAFCHFLVDRHDIFRLAGTRQAS